MKRKPGTLETSKAYIASWDLGVPKPADSLARSVREPGSTDPKLILVCSV